MVVEDAVSGVEAGRKGNFGLTLGIDRNGTGETLTTIGNGYLGTRGCFEGEKASETHYPGTYIAGIYNKPVMLENRNTFWELITDE